MMQAPQETQHFIAHRALLNGPNKSLENQPASIDACISQGYLVEIDVWYLPESDSFLLGHDGPEIKTTVAQLSKWAPFAYFHTKNVDALHALLPKCRNEGWRCFFHDIDEYTITRCICPHVAISASGPTQARNSLLVLSPLCPNELLSKVSYESNIELYRIYYEMRTRQELDLLKSESVATDALIQQGITDDRKCIAVYTFYDDWIPTPSFAKMKSHLDATFPEQNVYDPAPYSSNVLHFTIMQVFGFEQFGEYHSFFLKNQEAYFAILDQVLQKYLPFTITFRGLIAVKSGIVVAGYPSIDLNLVRVEICKLMDAQHLPFRKYTNNIVHSTICRATTHKEDLANQLVSVAETYRDTYFGDLKVTKFHLGVSSWRMMDTEIEPLGLISSI